jgi:ubiquinone/menaquinone biosynthesis C-methylase UbiE
MRNGEHWLDVGCGKDKIEGAVGIDRVRLPGVDIVADLNVLPWPVESSSVDHLVCKHVISHLNDFVATIEEMHRVVRPGGLVEILAPHYTSDNANTDPTIRTRAGIRTMNYFCPQYAFKFQYYSQVRFDMVHREISFREALTDFRSRTKSNIARLIGLEWLVNRFPRVYERFFAYMLPASEVYFKLRVIK